MDEQYKKMLEQLAEIRKKDRKITSIRPSGSSSIIGGEINMDFSSLYGNKSRRILKGKKILKNIQENDTKRES